MHIIKELRLENNLSKDQLAEALGISQMSVTRWESGQTEPLASSIVKLAKFFHVTADYILELEDDFGYKSYLDAQSAITPEEQKIITAYRRLSASNRKLILHMLKID